MSENERLRARVSELESRIERLTKQINAYVTEFRVCRFCTEIHSDCSPTDGSCYPRWRGL